MLIVESAVVTRRVTKLLADDEYRLPPQAWLVRPEWGRIIMGSGGLRKVRGKVQASGQRGGVRVIYDGAVSQDKILMLFIYGKHAHSDLTPAQIKVLKQIVEEEYP